MFLLFTYLEYKLNIHRQCSLILYCFSHVFRKGLLLHECKRKNIVTPGPLNSGQHSIVPRSRVPALAAMERDHCIGFILTALWQIRKTKYSNDFESKICCNYHFAGLVDQPLAQRSARHGLILKLIFKYVYRSTRIPTYWRSLWYQNKPNTKSNNTISWSLQIM